MTTTTTMTAWLGVVQSTHGEPLVDHFGFRFVDNCTTRRMLNLFLSPLPSPLHPSLSLSLLRFGFVSAVFGPLRLVVGAVALRFDERPASKAD